MILLKRSQSSVTNSSTSNLVGSQELVYRKVTGFLDMVVLLLYSQEEVL